MSAALVALESEPLTPREHQMLQHAANGYSSRETARVMWLTPRTVKFHRSNAIRKMDARNITEAVARAIREGLL